MNANQTFVRATAHPVLVGVVMAAGLSLGACTQAYLGEDRARPVAFMDKDAGEMKAVVQAVDAADRAVLLDNGETYQLGPNVPVDAIMIGKPVLITFRTDRDNAHVIATINDLPAE